MEKPRPLHKVIFDPEKKRVMNFLSLVGQPAIQVDFLALAAEIVIEFEAVADKQQLVGPFLIPGQKIARNFNGYECDIVFDAETIELIAQEWNKNLKNQNVNFEHQANSKIEGAYIAENWIVRNSESDKMNFYGFTLPVGTWGGIIKIENTQFWLSEVKTGRVKGFSIEGLFGLVEIEQSIKKHIAMQNIKDLKLRKVATLVKEQKLSAVAAATTAEGASIVIAADTIEAGSAITVIDEALQIVTDFTGELNIDGKVCKIEAGKITEVGAGADAGAGGADAGAGANAGGDTGQKYTLSEEDKNAIVEMLKAPITDMLVALEQLTTRVGGIESKLGESVSKTEMNTMLANVNGAIEKKADGAEKTELSKEQSVEVGLKFLNDYTDKKGKK